MLRNCKHCFNILFRQAFQPLSGFSFYTVSVYSVRGCGINCGQAKHPGCSFLPHPEPVPRKIRKSGTGCLYQINDNLWEGSFFPRLPNGKRKKFNVYAETKEQCEIKLAEMIERVKAEIAEEKAKLKEGDS